MDELRAAGSELFGGGLGEVQNWLVNPKVLVFLEALRNVGFALLDDSLKVRWEFTPPRLHFLAPRLRRAGGNFWLNGCVGLRVWVDACRCLLGCRDKPTIRAACAFGLGRLLGRLGRVDFLFERFADLTAHLLV